jgi:maltose/maltodextrin transport system permease protein
MKLALGVAGLLALLYALQGVYASGQVLLAVLLLAVGGLAVWAYSASRSVALRFLLPGIAAACVFVLLPLVYTIGMGFTNYSARNLLSLDEARDLLLGEQTRLEGSERRFTLAHTPGGLQIDLGEAGQVLVPDPERLGARELSLSSSANGSFEPLPLTSHVEHLPLLRALTLTVGDHRYTLATLREFAQHRPLYSRDTDGALRDTLTGAVFIPQPQDGFFTSDAGERLQPGYRVNVGWRHYQRLFTDARLSAPFVSVFVWTVVFAGLSVVLTAALGLVLAVLLNWQSLEGRAVYRLVLFLPYAVPAFISILIFKGLFNQNLGEINLILNGLFGIKPAWFSDPLMAKCMLVIVNLWLGFPYMTVLCSGLIQSIPGDLYEASAEAGASPWVNFSQITVPLILKPLTPLLIASFAFNFNNFVLISLLTGGRPDQLDATLPAGTTDILVSYTWRIAFQDSGQQFGLAAAISTLIFVLVAGITLVQMRLTQKSARA